jgi:16S rRNA (guanine966-N2)-methyltransferase
VETAALVRVIGGSLGGRRLIAPHGSRTRPTSDRVREALFMTLEPLDGLRVVDLFAGTGALGIEALSRGAAHVDFVERDPAARRALESNIATLSIVDRTTVWPLVLPQGLKRLSGRLLAADLVLVDPPYGDAAGLRVLEALGAAGCLAPEARVVFEHASRDDARESAGRLTRVRTRRYGDTAITLYRAASAEASAPPETAGKGDA